MVGGRQFDSQDLIYLRLPDTVFPMREGAWSREETYFENGGGEPGQLLQFGADNSASSPGP